MTEKEKQLVKEIISIQVSILTRGTTKAKEKRIEKRLLAIGFKEEELEGLYGI